MGQWPRMPLPADKGKKNVDDKKDGVGDRWVRKMLDGSEWW